MNSNTAVEVLEPPVESGYSPKPERPITVANDDPEPSPSASPDNRAAPEMTS